LYPAFNFKSSERYHKKLVSVLFFPTIIMRAASLPAEGRSQATTRTLRPANLLQLPNKPTSKLANWQAVDGG
jgi:hypothetical protein